MTHRHRAVEQAVEQLVLRERQVAVGAGALRCAPPGASRGAEEEPQRVRELGGGGRDGSGRLWHAENDSNASNRSLPNV
jgi:hypothetical protein